MAAKRTQEQFLEKAKAVHGETYDYSLVEYVGTDDKVKIICRGHGLFEQTPYNHCSGQGCKICGNKRNGLNSRTGQEKFLIKAKEVHGDTYEYSLVEYVKTGSKVKILCKEHGVFEQTPASHLRGAGCKVCGGARTGAHFKSNQDDFLTKTKAVHGGLYDYSLFEYKLSSLKSTIICRIHGEFRQTPNRHLMGDGCPKCGGERVGVICRKTQEQFLADAHKMHGDRYDYSETVYKDIKTKVKIGCRIHGEFWQNPSSHVRESGCPSCVAGGYGSNKAGTIYVLVAEDLTKVGITNKTPKSRVKFISKDSGLEFTEKFSATFEDGSIPPLIENILLKELRATHKNPKEKFNGSTECFYGVDYEELIERLGALISQSVDLSTNTTPQG